MKEQLFENDSQSKKLALGIASSFPCGKRKRISHMKSVLKKSFDGIEKVYLRSSYHEEKNIGIEASFVWLNDNFGFVSDEYAYLEKELGTRTKVVFSGKLPMLFEVTEKMLDACEGTLSDESIRDVVSAYDAMIPDGMDSDERASAKALIKCAAFSYMGRHCRKIADGDGIFESEKEGKCLVNSIKTLKKLAVYDFCRCFSELRLELLLSSDPGNIYSRMTNDSKASYRRKLKEYAGKRKISEYAAALHILEKAKNGTDEKSRHIGAYLGTGCRAAGFYFPALIAASFLLCAFLPYDRRLFFLMLFPVYETVKQLADFFLSMFFRKDSYIPELELEKIPSDAKTLCVITSLLCGEKKDAPLFSKLEKIYNANEGENIMFGLLCDLEDSDTATKSTDAKTIAYARGRISSLNEKYGNRFILFIRRRSYSKSSGGFMAWERKRGAVLELVRLITGRGPTNFDMNEKSLLTSLGFIRDTKYVITLDSDTSLGLGMAKRLVGKMLHPCNKPVVDEKRRIVTEGYGIMQPKMTVGLECAGATPFSRMMCVPGGLDVYSGADFELYQSLFGSGIFCGKGIFDVCAFEKVLDGKNSLPEEYILSHDILEGERMRTAQLCDIELCDGFPKNQLSYLKRLHRWLRGDIQNTRFLSHKYGFPTLSKVKLCDNVRRAVLPVAMLAIIVICAFFGMENKTAGIFFALLPLTLPFFINVFSLILRLSPQSAARKFYSRGVTAGIWQSFLRMLYFEAMLAKSAFVSMNAAAVSIYRMLFSKKKLLEWQTAAQSDSGRYDFADFAAKNILSAILGVLLFILSDNGSAKVCGLSFFLMPLIGYLTSADRKKDSCGNDTENADIRKYKAYAGDIWAYFRDHVNGSENHLPPDNVSFFPSEKTAHRTSPTNIGLYLVSVLAARDFGLVDTSELYTRVGGCIGTVKKLPKWKGNLYNWYDTQTLKILSPSYVSSVDCGNFLACLITLKNGLADYAGENTKMLELIRDIDALIENTDISELYDASRELFSVGISFEGNTAVKDEGCYDFFMSEARTLSYIALCRGTVPISHWKKLSRQLVSSDGYIGLASWSGTAFEYFMPCLFLPVRKGSLLYEAMRFALCCQKKRRAHGVWGISESAFFAFDGDFNYQYKAFGIPKIGLKRGLDRELVISPYSTYLSMCVSRVSAQNNLDALTKLGMYGKYGFYEACDFTSSRVGGGYKKIKCYMSHHMGMSLAALCNAGFGNIMVRRFMLDCKNMCGEELLEEKIPVNAVIKKLPSSEYRRKAPFSEEETQKSVTKIGVSAKDPVCAAISDGHASVIASDNGNIALRVGDTSVITSVFEKGLPVFSLFAFSKGKNGIASFFPNSLQNEKNEYAFSYSESGISYVNVCTGVKYTASFCIQHSARSLFRLKFEAEGDPDPGRRLCAVLLPQLEKDRDYFAHPAFSQLFIRAEYDEGDGILYFIRKPKNPSAEENVLAVSVVCFDGGHAFDFDTKLDDMPEFFPGCDIDALFSKRNTNRASSCIRPVLRINADLSGPTEILSVMTHSKASAREAIFAARLKSFADSKRELSEISSTLSLGAGISSCGSDGICTFLLSRVMLGGALRENGRIFEKVVDGALSFGKSTLWKYGISGDEPIFLLSVGAELFLGTVEKYIRAYKLLRMKNIPFDLVIIYPEKDRYAGNTLGRLCEILASCGLYGARNKKGGGVFFIEKAFLSQDIYALKCASCGIYEIFSEKPSFAKKREHDLYPALVCEKKEEHAKIQGFSVYGGSFSDGGFLTDKAENIRLPWSYVITGRNISCVLSQNSLGCTFAGNAHERRISARNGDAFSDNDSETLFLISNGKLCDLIRNSSFSFFSDGTAQYTGCVFGIKYKVTVFCCRTLCMKLVKVVLQGKEENVKLAYRLKPSDRRSTPEKRENGVFFSYPFSEAFSDYVSFVGLVFPEYEKALCASEIPELSGDDGTVSVGCAAKGNGEYVFSVGAYKKTSGYRDILSKLGADGVEKQLSEAKKFSGSLIPKITFFSNDANENASCVKYMFNTFLPYCTGASRCIARSGFYQSGGAYGFRDQLQDILCFMYADEKYALSHILRAASHQFIEGDVLHWWHPGLEKGVRTKCSDDSLWLVYAATGYFAFTGNIGMWKMKAPYITGEPLSENEDEKYMTVEKSRVSESLYDHCVRVCELALTRKSPRGLCLIGTGDWCDGMNRVGRNGRGESIWLSMFFRIVLERFSEICSLMGDHDKYEKYKNESEKLFRQTEEYGFDENSGYYIRATNDEGKAIGHEDCEECRIDLLPQSFAALYGADVSRSYRALKAAYERLFDKNAGIMRLFYPPFDKTKDDPGYIKGYIPGVRENGGQYTHAAIFFAAGAYECAGRMKKESPEKAKELAEMANSVILSSLPSYRMRKDGLFNTFMTEPYAPCADIYAADGVCGRGGWTHYTGASGWMYRVILRYIFGIRFENVLSENGKMMLDADLFFPMPDILDGSRLHIGLYGFDCTVKYIADGAGKIVCDGDGKQGVISFGKDAPHEIEVHLLQA